MTAIEPDIHDRGLVTLIRQHHDAIDADLAEAYGWGDEHRTGTLGDETVLTRLVALNAERATEEAQGLIRYLRPDYQDSGYRARVTDSFDLSDGPVAPVSNVIALARQPARTGRRGTGDPCRRDPAAGGARRRA